MASAYENYADEEGYAKVVTIDEIAEKDHSLNIALYVRSGIEVDPVLSVEECVDDWVSQSLTAREQTDALIALLTKEGE
jgi:type I restriction enzyme M protein